MPFPSRTEILTAIKNPQTCYKAKELIGGKILLKGTTVIQYAGGYTTVFPFINSSGKKVAIRCWCADIGDARIRSSAISDYLEKEDIPYFVNFKYVENALLVNGVLQPIVTMDWVEGKPLKEYINENCNPTSINKLADSFKLMVSTLHTKSIAHGDLQHGNILVRNDGSLVLVDYDSMYIDQIKDMSDVIKGLPGYQHPARVRNHYLNPQLDYFSELVIYLSLLIFAEEPEIWKYYYDEEDLLFTKEDFADFRHSTIYSNYYKSSNKIISTLIKKMEEELEKKTIKELLTLEELLSDQLKKSMDGIFEKFNKQPHPPQNKIINIPDGKSIINKF